jgi:4-amino-4-deoxy-L-arabinose transferase-like glycosyltransferase
LIFFSVKLLLAAVVPVFGDEAYYYIWSLHPQLSYFDHPGMVSWLIALGHMVLPAGYALSLRINFVILSFLASLIWLKILRDENVSENHQFWYFVFLFLNPLMGIGSIAATPDVPLVFFWSLSYLFFLRVLKNHKITDYAMLGLSLGLGFCSKYHIVLFVLSGLVYLIISKKFKELRLAGVLLTILTGAAASSPVVIWNAQNEWQSFKFQINHGFGENDFSWSWPVGYLLAQSFVINPFFLPVFFKRTGHPREKTFSLSQLLFFFYSSFKNVVEGNWPLTSHLHTILLAVKNVSAKQLKYALAFWIVFYVLIGGFLLSDSSEKVRKNLINSAQLDLIYEAAKTYKPLYGPSYQVSSLLSWKLQTDIPKLHLLSRHDFYDSLPESMPVEKSFYVLKNDYSDWPDEYAHYKKIKLQYFDKSGLVLYQFIYE